MTSLTDFQQVADKAVLHDAPPVLTTVNRTFELPVGLYVATVAAYLGFIGIMALGFGNPELAIPMVIFALFVVAGFGVPMLWTKIGPATRTRALDWGRLGAKGIQTFTGPVTRRDAAVQVLILPVLIVLWGLATVLIAALVR